MTVNFKFNNGGTTTDFDDVFIRKDIFSSGGLWSWGNNGYGRLGDNTTVNKSSPVQTISGGSDWKQVSAGTGHTAAIKTDGTLWLWGYNFGLLGDGTLASRSSPVQTISNGTNWKQVSCNGDHTAAIKTDGTLWLWGISNDYGAMGNGSADQIFYSSPVQTIAGGTNWKQVSVGGPGLASPDQSHIGAIKTDGTLWLWGQNSMGQIGDNTTTSKSSPVQTVSGGTNWKQVSCGFYFTAAIKTNGELWLWGWGSDGRLGDNTTVNKSSPVQTVSSGTNWKQVSAGDGKTAAIKTDGTLWLWGGNSTGQLGDNTIVSKSSPVQTVSGGTNWKQVEVCGTFTGAVKTDGTLWLWGQNTDGQLGDNSVTWRSSPVQTVAGGTYWKQVSVNINTAVGITEDFY